MTTFCCFRVACSFSATKLMRSFRSNCSNSGVGVFGCGRKFEVNAVTIGIHREAKAC